jgi:menaquinone-dependent protoporphyrinogen oxidase
MNDTILVVYASKFGSTREVADKVAGMLRENGSAVDVRRANAVKDIGGYTSVIMGTAIRMGKPITEAVAFAKRFHGELQRKPVAFFSVGLYMKEDTPANREKAATCLRPLLEVINQPVSIGLFGGKIDYKTMPLLLRWVFSKDSSGDLAEGDWRNWDTIAAWVRELIPLLRKERNGNAT